MMVFAGGVVVARALFNLIPETQSHNVAALWPGFFLVDLLEKLENAPFQERS
jgi:hypothetical protein